MTGEGFLSLTNIQLKVRPNGKFFPAGLFLKVQCRHFGLSKEAAFSFSGLPARCSHRYFRSLHPEEAKDRSLLGGAASGQAGWMTLKDFEPHSQPQNSSHRKLPH